MGDKLQGSHDDVSGSIPKDGDTLIFTSDTKTWGPGQIVSRADGPYGDGVIQVIAVSGYVANLKTHTGTPSARIPFDAIATCVYGGVKPYTYAIRKSGGAWSSSTNPSLCYVELGVAELGPNNIEIKVTDSNSDVDTVTTDITLQDNYALAP